MREILVILLFKLYFCDQIEADMIETFIIKNYRSYRDKTELSFVASNKEGGKKKDLPPVWFKEINGKRILRLLLCVGLNGTGKSLRHQNRKSHQTNLNIDHFY